MLNRRGFLFGTAALAVAPVPAAALPAPAPSLPDPGPPGRLRYDASRDQWMVSVDGGSYQTFGKLTVTGAIDPVGLRLA